MDFDGLYFIGSALTSEYWVHVDYCPGHKDLDVQAEEELIATLRHGCIGA